MNIEQLPGIGKDKWIRYHFEGTPLRANPKSNITAMLTQSTSRLISFKQACKEVAEDIYETTKSKGQSLFVSMSGGCDSELVARSFHENGIPFTPVIVDNYIEGRIHVNHEDSWWAKRWCRLNGLKPYMIVNQSISEILIRNAGYCEKIKARQPAPIGLCYVADHVKNLGGVLVGGMGFPEYFPDYTLDYMYDPLYDSEAAPQKPEAGWIIHESDFQIDMNDPGYHPYNFLSWTPEIVLAYVNERNMQTSSEENKFVIMDCLPRPKIGQLPVMHQALHEYAKQIRKKYGSVEAAWLGTHEEFKNQLYKL
jgi:hypothetical protein